jgi:hypothetical protein
VAINLYRRHRLDCEAGHPEEFRSGEFEERKKGWKRCACVIFASGTLVGEGIDCPAAASILHDISCASNSAGG